jgi:hypothetical protein
MNGKAICLVRISERTQTIVCWGHRHSKKESENIQSLDQTKRKTGGFPIKRDTESYSGTYGSWVEAMPSWNEHTISTVR